jgi:hypothetical protein
MNEEDQKILDQISIRRRAQTMALAYLKRAKDAGIPEKYQRIGPLEFQRVLSEDYHEDVGKITNFVYKDVLSLIKTPFILIDGGDNASRKKAAFAILFRIITCDKFALYKRCNEIEKNLSTFTSAMDMSRKDWADQYKKYDVLYIDEFKADLFKTHYDAGDFLDDILEYRSDHSKPTIIAFRRPLSKANVLHETNCGDCIRRLSQKEYPDSYIKGEETLGSKVQRVFQGEKDKQNPYNGVLRVRVKVIEGSS